MTRNVCFNPDAWEQYVWWQDQDRRTLQKINRLIKAAQRDPENGEGQPEQLSADFADTWSRHIDRQNRLVYWFTDGFIEIIQVRGHYDD